MVNTRVDRKREILSAAASLFQRQGYHLTTMQEIAEEIGILKGSLYHHYRSKQEILFEMTRAPLENMVARAREIADQGLPFETKVREVVRIHLDSLVESYPYLMVITAERDDSLPEGMREQIVGLRRHHQDSWKRILEEGREQGRVRDGVPIGVLASLALGAINWMHRWYDPSGAVTPAEMADAVSEFVLTGISPAATPT